MPVAISTRAPQTRPRPATWWRTPGRLRQVTRRVWTALRRGSHTFFQIDGSQWAAAFAFNAFFSLFPLIVLLVTVGSFFVDRDRAGNDIVAYLESHWQEPIRFLRVPANTSREG